MSYTNKNEHILKLGIISVFVSFIFMILALPGAYYDTLPNENNSGAAIGIVLAAILRIAIYFWCIGIIKNIRNYGRYKNDRRYLFFIAILLLFFGLFYSLGAYSLSNNEPYYVSAFMFISLVCDLIAVIFILFYLFTTRK